MKRAKFFKSKFLRPSDIPDTGIVYTIAGVVEEHIGPTRQLKPVLKFDDEERGLVLNITNWSTPENLYGDDSDDWIGNAIELFVTEVEFAGERRPAIRLRKPTKRPVRRSTATVEDDDGIPF